ncbi:hypothetical protein N7456_007109 [Penicillium angulare]|uniref:Uncharacterized protein n=1 Tax=Penicillium angulare TaxID=116970 RepID=A0A9W9KDJ3_9EURO|nr:hypothetical protein N7456_007109 [Penicillium angulare]
MLNRLPIPRLPDRLAYRKPDRVSRACDECRSHKNAMAICQLVASVLRRSCRHRDRERNELELAKEKIDYYERLLREVSQEVELPLTKKIERALQSSPQRSESQEDGIISSHASSLSSVGSLDALESLDEDVNESKSSRATVYFDKSSEISWLRSLDVEANGPPGSEKEIENSRKFPHPRTAPTASMNYHIDPAEYPGLEVDNPYALPAKALIPFYLGISKHPGRKWLALLNPVFAICNKLCQLSGRDVQDKDHGFFSRAQTLNISESLVEDHEDLQQVQIETLAAFYPLNSSHINRAWKMIGTATRSGIPLGLHLRATHSKLNPSALEARYKL